MRVLFVVASARPHLFPLVPLAWACRAAGHEVRIASAPSLGADLIRTGMPAVLVGGPQRRDPVARAELVAAVYSQDPWPLDWGVRPHALDAAQRAHVERLGRSLLAGADAMLDDLVAFGRTWRPHLIVYDAASYAGPVAAAVLGVPGVRHVFGTAVVPRYELRAGSTEPLPEYVRMFERFDRFPATAPALTVDPTPPSMRLAADTPRLDQRYVPYNGSGTAPAWLWGPRSRPRVCVTWGHTAPRALGDAAAEPYREAVHALAELNVEVVVVSTAEQLRSLGPVPGTVRPAVALPLHLLMPSTDLIVHQGGDGTTLTAAAYGVPQLAITQKPDAELPAGRLAAVGAGIHLCHQNLRADPGRRRAIRAAAGELLSGGAHRAAAYLLRQEIARQPPPADLVSRLVALAAPVDGRGVPRRQHAGVRHET
jgi:glycosyltransferase